MSSSAPRSRLVGGGFTRAQLAMLEKLEKADGPRSTRELAEGVKTGGATVTLRWLTERGFVRTGVSRIRGGGRAEPVWWITDGGRRQLVRLRRWQPAVRTDPRR